MKKQALILVIVLGLLSNNNFGQNEKVIPVQVKEKFSMS